MSDILVVNKQTLVKRLFTVWNWIKFWLPYKLGAIHYSTFRIAFRLQPHFLMHCVCRWWRFWF